ncbi:1-deoxy-D-xylulose-5-phosphate reductoisomerase [Arcticibacter sp.]|uniref:1-deoxy-D-xylulose-5-phosphate reductoisomerase n=1 Tax=Arcticibacter sp. TaxID=1872630 RepID=UPI00388E7B5F
MKHIAILGSSGSIGTQALEVIRDNPDRFKISVLTAGNNGRLLIEQAREFKPLQVVIGDERQHAEVRSALEDLGIEVFAGEKALTEVVQLPSIDVVLTAVVGFCGLRPTIAAIKAGKDIALANKETMVVAGELVNALAKKHKVSIFPVDSEHSAIFQCLQGEQGNKVEKIYLTASGGPFRGKSKEFLSTVTKGQALQHPNWVMGAKITIDSASLMNKGLEVIEAKWLFDLKPAQIDVIVHPQSIIHSIAQFEDGSMKAQMGLPDMKLPIQYALGYPDRILNSFPRFDFLKHTEMTFEQPDRRTFRNLQFAFDAMEKGGNSPCVLNAANEIVVQAFLDDRLGFLEMSDIIEKCMSEVSYIRDPNLEDFIETDTETRKFASQLVTNY